MNLQHWLLCAGFAVLSWSGVCVEAAPKSVMVSQAGALLPKWTTFKAPGLEFSLPENYVGGSPDKAGLQRLVTALRKLGSLFEPIADLVEQNPSAYVLVAVDPKPDAAGGITNVVVATEQISTTLTLDNYLDTIVKQLPTQIKPVERKLVTIGQNQAGRLVTEAKWEQGTMRQLLYVIKQGRTIWTIAYSTGAREYDRRLPVFEQSIATFKGKPLK